jgi:hypothetical protein
MSARSPIESAALRHVLLDGRRDCRGAPATPNIQDDTP